MVRRIDTRLSYLERSSTDSLDGIEFAWIEGDVDGSPDDYTVILKWSDDDGKRGDLWQGQSIPD